ncbi:MAG: hypothetical protein HOO96_34325 [Polyangiaceae bacterium]|nr:hypothetical protein [Polyangiaceae bacterium]
MPRARAHWPRLQPDRFASRRHRSASASSSIFRALATENLRVAPEPARRVPENHPGVADGSRRCGDGRLETGLEACDDANADDTDGCDRTCAVVPVTGPRCGNGRVEGAEECDAASPACSATCAWTVVKDYEQPGDHSTAAGAIELGNAMRRGQGRLESSNYLRPVDYWAFTLDRPARVQIDISGSLYGSPGCYSEIYGNGEVRSADGSVVWPFYPNGMLANDFDRVLPAGRYFFSVVGDYTRCTIGGSEYVGGWYGVKLDVTP